jgi:hypothetical protein
LRQHGFQARDFHRQGVEILLLLGLQKQVVASAFWPTTVLPQLAEQNAKMATLLSGPSSSGNWAGTKSGFCASTDSRLGISTVTTVLPQLAEQNAKIKTLTVEIPSLESVLAQNPDFQQQRQLGGNEIGILRQHGFQARDFHRQGFNLRVLARGRAGAKYGRNPAAAWAAKAGGGQRLLADYGITFCPSATTRSGGRVKVS